MSRTLAAGEQIAELELAVEARGIRPNRSFRRGCGELRYRAVCEDLAELRAEALANAPRTWASSFKDSDEDN